MDVRTKAMEFLQVATALQLAAEQANQGQMPSGWLDSDKVLPHLDWTDDEKRQYLGDLQYNVVQALAARGWVEWDTQQGGTTTLPGNVIQFNYIFTVTPAGRRQART